MLPFDALVHRAEHLGKSFKKRLKLFARQGAMLEGVADGEVAAEVLESVAAAELERSEKKSKKKKDKKVARERVDLESLRRQAVEVADLELTLGGWGAGHTRALVVEGEVLAAELTVAQLAALQKWLKRVETMYVSAGRRREVARVGEVAREVEALLERWRSEEVPTVRVGEAVLGFVERGE